jgi:transposase-like protein
MYRAMNQVGQIIDVYVSKQWDTAADRCFFTRALTFTNAAPVEVTTDRVAVPARPR